MVGPMIIIQIPPSETRMIRALAGEVETMITKMDMHRVLVIMVRT